MSVVLDAIKFNHDPNSVQTNALNIRKNDIDFITVPEWQRGISTTADDSRAAYAIQATAGQTLSIEAKFLWTGSPASDVEVRAIDPGNPRAQGCLYAILKLLGITPILPPPYGNCLGEVKPRTVAFGAGGVSAYETFELDQVWPLSAFRTGIYTVTWQWQYRHGPNQPWIDFDTSYHRIYLVQDVPTAPWQQTPYSSGNIQLPWTDALDKACVWAAGASSKNQVAARITRAVNTLALQSYTPATIFGFSTYHLSSYLQALNGGTPFQLNCTDCANAVTTFANIHGCDLVEGRFFSMTTRPFLTLNGDPADPNDWVSWGWSYHEICWLGQMGQNEFIYDGCLQVDMDDNYADNVHIAKHPIKMRFGMSDPQDYRYRLIESGAGNLENIPRHRIVD